MAQLELPGTQGRRNTRRTTTHNQDVHQACRFRFGSTVLQATGNLINRPDALVDPMTNQGHAAQFARDEDAGYGTLQIIAEDRDVRAGLDIAQPHGDRANGTDLFAISMPHTPRGMHQTGGLVNDRQHPLGTNASTTTAADAPMGIDVGMLTKRLVRADALGLVHLLAPTSIVRPPRSPLPQPDEQQQSQKGGANQNGQRPVYLAASFCASDRRS